jgi:hypothetical protein
MADIKFGVNKQAVGPTILGPLEVSGETKVRFIIENATINNTIEIRGRIKGQNSWDLLTTFTGNAAQNVNVNVYDELEIEITTYEATGNYVRILASGFNPAEGSAINTIGVPFGENVEENPRVNFTSSDNSVHISGTQGTGTIDFTVSASSNPNSYSSFVPTTGSTPTANSSGDSLTMLSVDNTIIITGNNVGESLDFGVSSLVKNNLVKQEARTLTLSEYDGKQLTLAAAPLVASKTRMVIIGGPEQKYSIDFLVSGTTLTWSSLGIDGIIEIGDTLLITYP